MKARDLRDMTDDELDNALHDRRKELFDLRFQSATGALGSCGTYCGTSCVRLVGSEPVCC